MFRFLFLDIDGVLNTNQFLQQQFLLHEEHVVDYNDPANHIMPEKVDLINHLVKETGALVVLSSSWRIVVGVAKTQESLNHRGATFEIFGATRNRVEVTGRMSQFIPRWVEIQDFLLRTGKQHIENFVILDDLDEASNDEMRSQFIQTDPNVGLSNEQFEQAISILNGTCKFDFAKQTLAGKIYGF